MRCMSRKHIRIWINCISRENNTIQYHTIQLFNVSLDSKIQMESTESNNMEWNDGGYVQCEIGRLGYRSLGIDITCEVLHGHFLHPHFTSDKPLVHPSHFSTKIQADTHIASSEKAWPTKIRAFKFFTYVFQIWTLLAKFSNVSP